MAKKNTKNTKNDVVEDSSLKDDVAFLNKEYGSGFLLLGDDTITNIPTISTGIPDLDKTMAGGFARGKVGELFGGEQSGKTWILLKTYAAAQKEGFKCLHFDIEQSLNMGFAKMNGVDIKKLAFYQPGENDYAENLLEKISEIAASGKFDIIGVDSVAALVPKEELEKSLEDQQMALLARVMSRALRKIIVSAAQGNTTVVFINQTRTKVGQMYGNPEETPGGKALKFYSSFRVKTAMYLPTKTDYPDLFEGEQRIGHILKTQVVKLKYAPPFGQCEIPLMYKAKRMAIEAIGIAIEENIIEKNKSNHKRFKYNGSEILLDEKGNYDLLIENLRNMGVFMEILEKIGFMDFERMIEDGDLTEEMVEEYIKSKAE